MKAGLTRAISPFIMALDPRLQLDMTPDGRFRAPPRLPVSTRIIAVAMVVAVVVTGLAFAAFALWLALTLIPIAIVAVALAYGLIRFKLWRLRRRASVGGEGRVVRWR